MLKIFKYLKRSRRMIFAIVVLLFLQAYCDLALPEYTSKIVNVGIQQSGIEDAVPKEIREETFAGLLLLMNEEDSGLVEQSFTKRDGTYVLNHISKSEREQLNEIFGVAMMVLSGISADSDEVKQMPESMVTGSSISFVKNEYQAIGIDLDQMQTDYLLKSGGKMLVLALLVMVAAVLVVYMSSKVAARLSNDLRSMVYKKVIGFSSHELNQFSIASLITRSTNDIQQIQQTMMMIFRIVLYAPILGLGGVLKVFQTNTSMAWIIGVAVLAILAVVMVLFAVAMPKFKSLQVLIDKLNLVTREILNGIPVIRAFCTQKTEEERFGQANNKLMKTNLFVNRCMSFLMPTMILIMNAITALIVYRGSYGVDAGQMQVGDLMAFIQYTMQIIMSFLMMSMMSIMIPRASVSAGRVNEILETKNSIEDPVTPKVPIKAKKGVVEFKHVSFSYPDAEEEVLTDISFVANPGETTAFIGSTGSGKSTLINLIPRFFDVTKGSIEVDGVDIKDMTQHDLRELIGYVPQKGVLFSGTIESNLRYGRENATEEEIRKAAFIAQAINFVEEKPEKFQAPIAQGGTNVSGGQKQRLSIARAIAKMPQIYIFDDSFSALDYKTDMVLRRELKKETKGATTLIVAQRINTILHADQIIVMEDGKIAGRGTHHELMESCEVYEQIALSQLSERELNAYKEAASNE